MGLKKIPLKNYIKYGTIVFFTLLLCILIFIIYNNSKDNDSSILTNKVKEIEVQDLNNYITENETVLLYFGVERDEFSKNIEEQMIEMIDEDNLEVIYVNLTNVKNKIDYLKRFSQKYSDTKIVNDYPAFVYIKDGVIVDAIQKDDRYLEKEDVQRFVEINDIKGEKDA